MVSANSVALSSFRSMQERIPFPLCQYILSLELLFVMTSVLPKPHSMSYHFTIEADAIKYSLLFQVFVQSDDLVGLTVMDPASIQMVEV